MSRLPVLYDYLDGGLFTRGEFSIAIPKKIEQFIRTLFTGSTTGIVKIREHSDLFRIASNSDLFEYLSDLPQPDLDIRKDVDPVPLLTQLLATPVSEAYSFFSLTLRGDFAFSLRDILLSSTYPTIDRVAAAVVTVVKYFEQRYLDTSSDQITGKAYTEAVLAINAASMGFYPKSDTLEEQNLVRALEQITGTGKNKPSIEDVTVLYQEVLDNA